jgi:hypothetical protein
MPTVTLPLEEVDQSVVRQSILGIVRSLLTMTKLDSKVSTILHGDIKYATTDNKFNAVTSTEPNTPNVASDRKVVVSVAEEYDEDALYATPVGEQEYCPIFLDTVTGLSIWPVYVDTNFVITFAYTTPSKSEAIRWRDNMRARLAQFKDLAIHDVTYDVILPEAVENIITDVYDLRNRLLPQTVQEYFGGNSSKRLKLITDLTGNNAKLALSEKQGRIQGMFDFTGGPEKAERSDDDNTYTITFNYKLMMNKPFCISMKYLPMVCNRLMPRKYLDFIDSRELLNNQEKYKDSIHSKSGFAFSYFEAHRQLENAYDIRMPINVPSFDIVNERNVTPGYGVVTTMLVQVDEGDKRSLFNLGDLDPYYIDADFVDWIREEEYQYITKLTESVLYLGYNSPDKCFNKDCLVVDQNLNVSSSVDLSLTSLSRVYLNFVIDLSLLSKAACERLLNRPAVFTKFVTEWVVQSRNFPEIRAEANKNNACYLSSLSKIVVKAGRMWTSVDFEKLKSEIKKLDPRLYDKIVKTIATETPIDWKELYLDGRFTERPKATAGVCVNADSGVMRTVQTSYVLVLRKEKVNANH